MGRGLSLGVGIRWGRGERRGKNGDNGNRTTIKKKASILPVKTYKLPAKSVLW